MSLAGTARAALAGLAACLLLVTAAGAETVYRRGNDADPETLDVHKTSTVAEAVILADLYEGLVVYDARGEVIPGEAESWTVSPDGLTWTFRLRADGRWSNGDPVRAGDFVAAYRRIMDPETGAKYAGILFPIRGAQAVNAGKARPEELGVAAPDDRTLVLTLERPTPYFLELLTHQTSLPIHAASLAQYGAAFVQPGHLVSNGAYVLKDFTPNDHITVVKNPYFHDAGAVQIDTVQYFPTSDLAAAVRRYQAGELDSLSDLPADQIKSLKSRFGDQVVLGPYLGVTALIVNLRKKPLDDPRVRRALSLVIDREFLAGEVYGETMQPAYGLVPPGIANYREPPVIEGRDLSPIDREDQARALLKEAGYGEGGKPLSVEIRYNTTDNNRNAATAIADMWRGIGVATSFINTDAKTHFAYLRDGGDFDVARYGWIGDYSDPQNFLFLLESDNTGFNDGHYANPAYDALMRQAADERSMTKRADILFQAESLALKDLPWIPLMVYGTKNLISPRLHGFHQNLRGAMPTRFLSIGP